MSPMHKLLVRGSSFSSIIAFENLDTVQNAQTPVISRGETPYLDDMDVPDSIHNVY